jgi:hypothetical protein
MLSFASFTVATSDAVSPKDAKLRLVGDRVTELATWDTVTGAILVAAPDVTVIIAVPFAIAVTSPADDTVAFVVSEDAHVAVAPVIVLSLASFTLAVIVAVSPNDAKLRLVGDRVTELAPWDTVTVAVLLAEPDVAVIVAVPSATEITKPADDTVAFVVSEDAHVTVAPVMVLSLVSFTVATSDAVSPNEPKLRLVGDRVTALATWVTVAVDVLLTEPDVAVIVAVPFAIAVTSPADETVAFVVSEDVHVTVVIVIVLSFASLTVGTSDAVSPNEAKFRLSDDRVIELTTWATLTVAVLLATPVAQVLVAVIVAVPFVMAVTSPADETVAIVVSESAQVTVASGMVSPASSLTVKVRLAVSPSDTNASDVSDNVTAAVDTLIESGLVAIWASPLVTFAANSLVPVEVGVPEIVDPTRDSPAGSVPALIDQE